MYQFRKLECVESGKSIYTDWFNSLDAAPAARIDRYVRRTEHGKFGGSKAVGEGVRELRIDFGPGYRVSYGLDEGTSVLLLGGGTKRNQSPDIKKAIDRWTAYRRRKKQR